MVLPFVASVAESVGGGIGLGDGSFRVSMASFATIAEEHVAFDAHTDAAALRAAIEASPYAAGATFTSLGFELVNNTVLPQARALSAGVPRVLIVIIDGPASIGFDASTAAADVRSQFTSILAVGVNGAISSELIAMASSPTGSTVFEVSEFNQLASLVPAISDQTCDIAQSFTMAPTKPPTTASPTQSPNCGINVVSDGECASVIDGMAHYPVLFKQKSQITK